MRKTPSIFVLAFTLLFLQANALLACDFCLLSQGISPLETIRGAGVRITERYTRLDTVYNGTKKAVNPGAKEEFWTTELTGFYGLTEDLTIIGVAPLKKTMMKGELIVNPDGSTSRDPVSGDESGIGDIALIGRYTFFKAHTLDTTSTAAALLGIKLPTGKTNGRVDGGAEFLDSHLQLGTGGTDYIAGLSFSRAMGKASFSTNLLGALNSEGKAGDTRHRFGNALNYDLTAKYRIQPSTTGQGGPQIFIALGVNGELREREKTNGVEDPNSGGHTAYISPGVQMVFAPGLVFELSYQKAVYHNLYGAQLG
ncbi:MAG: transporter, partial [Deltaproteobacteria bacterium]|nr:transporter [Deltaproteobacteria bacterium]